MKTLLMVVSNCFLMLTLAACSGGGGVCSFDLQNCLASADSTEQCQEQLSECALEMDMSESELLDAIVFGTPTVDGSASVSSASSLDSTSTRCAVASRPETDVLLTIYDPVTKSDLEENAELQVTEAQCRTGYRLDLLVQDPNEQVTISATGPNRFFADDYTVTVTEYQTKTLDHGLYKWGTLLFKPTSQIDCTQDEISTVVRVRAVAAGGIASAYYALEYQSGTGFNAAAGVAVSSNSQCLGLDQK